MSHGYAIERSTGCKSNELEPRSFQTLEADQRKSLVRIYSVGRRSKVSGRRNSSSISGRISGFSSNGGASLSGPLLLVGLIFILATSLIANAQQQQQQQQSTSNSSSGGTGEQGEHELQFINRGPPIGQNGNHENNNNTVTNSRNAPTTTQEEQGERKEIGAHSGRIRPQMMTIIGYESAPLLGRFERLSPSYINYRRSVQEANAARVAAAIEAVEIGIGASRPRIGARRLANERATNKSISEVLSDEDRWSRKLILAPLAAQACNDTNQLASAPIRIDKIKGIEFPAQIWKRSSGQGEQQDESESDSQTKPKMARQKVSSFDHTKGKKCGGDKYDQIIAQNLSLNQLSRPVIKSDGRFDNPFDTWRQVSAYDIIKFGITERDLSNVPKSQEELERELPMVEPKFEVNENERDRFRATWIGHSTVLIQVNGFNILTDPMFSQRASPSQYFGPKRIRDPACDIGALPRIDIVLISHNHYDHLDEASVRQLNDRFGASCRWIVPLGLGEFLSSMSVENYVELDWWEKDCQAGSSANRSSSSDSVPYKDIVQNLIIATGKEEAGADRLAKSRPIEDKEKEQQASIDVYLTPAQHWSRRGLSDTLKTLWGSYTIVAHDGSTFFFGGDTGYCTAFKQIGKVFGPFSGAAIPIGAYHPRWFMKYSHVDPGEAVKIHSDLGSMKSIAIHHSTFSLAYEPYKEPRQSLAQIMAESSETVRGPFIDLKHGESTQF